MERISLGNGQWFNPKKSKCFEEDRFFDGRNYVSKATGSQWEHESLYRTTKGTWILHRWSQWQGSQPSYEIVSEETAKDWLIAQEEHEAVETYWPGTVKEREV